MENKDTGLLLNKQNIDLQKDYFKEMVRLLGIKAIYKAPISSMKNYSLNGNLDTPYAEGIICGCIFEEHPTIKTMKTLGWATELSESASIIHVPFDLENLQVGGRFIIPSPLNEHEGKLFRIISISATMIYPASFACQIAPEYETKVEKSTLNDFTQSDFNLLTIHKKD